MQWVSMWVLALALCACEQFSSAPGNRQARALSKEALTELYHCMDTLQQKLPKGRGMFNGDSARLPQCVRSLDAVFVEIGHLDRIVLSGGFDDKAALMFEGLSRPRKPQIWLVPGDTGERELLWEGDALAAGSLPGVDGGKAD